MKPPAESTKRVVALVLVGTFATYGALHSPLRPMLASLFGIRSGERYFHRCRLRFDLDGRGTTSCGHPRSRSPGTRGYSGRWAPSGQLPPPWASSSSESAPIRRAAAPVPALILIVGGTFAAWLVSHRVAPGSFERPIVFGIGLLGFVSIPSAFVGELGAVSGVPLLRPPVGPLLAAVPSMAVIVGGRFAGWRFDTPAIPVPRSRLARVLLLTSAIGLAATIRVALVHPPSGYDALAYHGPLAVSYWRDGTLLGLLPIAPRHWPLAQPGAGELWTGLLRLVGGERAANLAQLPFALLGGCGVAAFSRRLGIPAGPAAIGGAAFLLAPLVLITSAMQLNDVISASVVIGAAALIAAPRREWQLGRLVAVGAGLGLAATIKLAVLPAVFGLGFVTVVTAMSQDGPRRGQLVSLAAFFGTFAVAVFPWWLRNGVLFRNPVFPADVPLLGRGISQVELGSKDRAFVPRPSAWPLYPLLEAHSEYSGFGILFLASLPGVVYAIPRVPHLSLIVLSAAGAPMMVAWWFFSRHEPRFLLSLAGLVFAFLPTTLLALPRASRGIWLALIAAAGIFSVAVSLDQSILPRLRHRSQRESFYGAHWGVSPHAMRLPEAIPLLLITGCGASTYPALYPLLGPTQSRTVAVLDCQSGVSVSEVADAMARWSIDHVYLRVDADHRPVALEFIRDDAFKVIAVDRIGSDEAYLMRHIRADLGQDQHLDMG